MKLTINEQVYEVDKAHVEGMFRDAIDKFLNLKATTPKDVALRDMVRTGISTILGFLGMKNPEFRKPHNVDALEFAAGKLAEHALMYFEEHGLELKGKLLEAATNADSKQAD